MNRPDAIPQAVALNFGRALAFNAEGGAPEWVQLLPRGPKIEGRDGRAWNMADPAAVVARSRTPFAIDYEHAQDNRAIKGEEAPASGWVEQLAVRDGQVWARVAWTKRAAAAIAAREYRFLSPVFSFDGAGNVIELFGAGLVNRPNLDLTALNGKTKTASPPPSPSLSLNAKGTNAMLIGPAELQALFYSFNFAYKDGFTGAVSHVDDVAFETSSTGSEEVYPFLGQFPPLREWIGDRVVNQLAVHGWTIQNRKFESTVAIKRTVIEDDRYGVFGPMFKQLGYNAKLHPDSLVFPLLNAGFTTPCYDGQNFFSATHPVQDANGNDTVVSNVQAGSGPAWFLLSTNQAYRPLIWQKRIPYEFQALVSPTDTEVFFRDEYLYGVRARVNAGYGLWQLAFGSQAPLSADNYSAARAAMMSLRGDRGTILGVMPDLLVVPPSLEEQARTLLTATTVAEVAGETIPVVGGTGGTPGTIVPVTNVWHQSANLLVTPFLA